MRFTKNPMEARRLGLQLLSHTQLVARLLGRGILAAIKFPGVAQVVCFALLFWVANHIWRTLFKGVWEPGFPKGWTIFVCFIVVVPFFALSQLLWLFAVALVARKCGERTRGNGARLAEGEAGYMMLENRSDGDWEDRDGSRRSPTPRSSPPGFFEHTRSRVPALSNLWWWTQVTVYATLVVVGLWSVLHYEYEGDIRYRPALEKALAQKTRSPAGNAKGEKIFIAAAFHQNQDVLPYWTSTLLDTIAYLGPANVFVSIVENYSNDRSPDLLRDLQTELDKLNVKNRILIQDETIKRPEDMNWNPRIDFLAGIRNQILEPLLEHGGYDKVIFSNDVFIEPESVIELLETNGGNFDFACGLDFGHFGLYDAWVLRDRAGRLASGIWPYFFDKASYDAMHAETPVPVFTCWNGIVAFVADPFLPVHLRSNRTLSTNPLPNPPPDTHPMLAHIGPSPALTPPVRFRSSAPSECFSSESFLVPYDFRRVMDLQRMYVNSRVIVGYSWKYYVWHKWVLRERHVKWFIEKVWDGAWMQYARMIVGDGAQVWTWDGGDCHPWW